MFRIALRGPALLMIGLVLLAYSTLALAQSAPPNYGPDWSIIATAALGVVVLLVGAYAKGLDGRVARVEVQIGKLQEVLLRDYHSKSDSERTLKDGIAVLRAEMATITNSVGQVYGELQRIRGPHA